ncbi:predicted protein, partial [Haematococcus lacustris]
MACLSEQLRAVTAEAEALRAAGGSAVAVTGLHAALSRSQRELTDLQTEYSKAVYEMTKAKAEHRELAGRLDKWRNDSGLDPSHPDPLSLLLEQLATSQGRAAATDTALQQLRVEASAAAASAAQQQAQMQAQLASQANALQDLQSQLAALQKQQQQQ